MTAGGGGGNTIFFLIFVLVGLKEACMSNFSFLGSFSGTSPGRPGGRMLDISKLRLTQPSLAGSWAELGKKKWLGLKPLKLNMPVKTFTGERLDFWLAQVQLVEVVNSRGDRIITVFSVATVSLVSLLTNVHQSEFPAANSGQRTAGLHSQFGEGQLV